MSRNRKEKEIEIIRVTEKEQEKVTDLVAKEIFINIYVNQNFLVSLSCSPGNLKYLATGYLYSTGIVKDKKEIISITSRGKSLYFQIYNPLFFQKEMGSLNLMPVNKQKLLEPRRSLSVQNNSKININTIFSLMSHMEERAIFFKLTGAVHSCGLADANGSILLFHEDLSRYNTIDRILGEAFLKNMPTGDKIILTSCRITTGIIGKIIVGDIPIVISRAAPTDYAIKLAERRGITLIGFTRGKRMNVYSHSERIINIV